MMFTCKDFFYSHSLDNRFCVHSVRIDSMGRSFPLFFKLSLVTVFHPVRYLKHPELLYTGDKCGNVDYESGSVHKLLNCAQEA